MTTLSDGTTTLTLPPDLMWSDEFAWSAVEQSVEYSVTGSLIIQTGARQAGRPITLAGDNDLVGWATRSLVETLRTWADTPGLEMTLVLRGVSHNVIFRHSDGAVSAQPVVPFNDTDAADYYTVVLRFMKV